MKYLFFDVDGTLLGKSRFITDNTIKALHKVKEAGHKVFICTGRAPTSIVGGNLEKVPADGFIASAGGFVNVEGEYIFKNYIDPTTLMEVMTLFTNHKVLFALETEKAIYQTPGVNEFFDMKHHQEFGDNVELQRFFELKRVKENRTSILEFDPQTIGVTKVSFIAQDRYLFLDIVKYLTDHFNVVTFNSENDDFINGEIILKNCTKADGIKRVLKAEGGSLDDTISFGDSMNDYQMVATTHEAYVSKKAPEKLKDIATGTFEDPDADGIAHLLDTLHLY
ncbi:MAG: Cof-type HAD-IIB family hydrolase [Intestinibaculum porci]|jgi:Cof subfamily protein (haloacid dehalogenase superfamily)|uniref:Cof-type HAD-IIB family hydrolase n=1 Tax=Intestinibaculum porci TaxID=2487118 RepID=UPI003F0DC732